MVGTWKQTLPTRAHLSEEGCWGRALEPLGCHDCLLPSGPLSDAARARGGGTRPVPPVRARRSCCTSSSWSSCGTCACPSRGLVGGGWGGAWPAAVSAEQVRLVGAFTAQAPAGRAESQVLRSHVRKARTHSGFSPSGTLLDQHLTGFPPYR